MCFVWTSEQRAIIFLYSINWLVFITETESVYCTVRTEYLNVIQVIYFIWISEQTAIISLYIINWLVFVTEAESVYCAVRTEYLNVIRVMCFIWISEQTAIISQYGTNWLVFVTETECVYCAVRTESLNKTLHFVLNVLKVCALAWLEVTHVLTCGATVMVEVTFSDDQYS
jgi:hypothetical protein